MRKQIVRMINRSDCVPSAVRRIVQLALGPHGPLAGGHHPHFIIITMVTFE